MKIVMIFAALFLIVYALNQVLSPADYRSFPMTGSRVAAWVMAQLHLFFAAFVLGVPIFAMIVEIVGVATKDERYDRLAWEFTRLLVLAFTATAVLAGLMPLLVVMTHPSGHLAHEPGFHRRNAGHARKQSTPEFFQRATVGRGEPDTRNDDSFRMRHSLLARGGA